MNAQFAYLLFGVMILAIATEQMPHLGGWLLLVIVMGALVLAERRNII